MQIRTCLISPKKYRPIFQGIFNHVEQRPGYFDEELIVPIVENAREDYLLCDTVAEAIRQYPQTNAVILRQEPLN